MATVTLSLISHTNTGKTTLARTLLARDVGEVRDAPHVTAEATAYTLQTTPEGDALALWDTPGFGDSARLARRLALEGNPIGWFLSEVWDRLRERAFWLTQKAVRNVRDHADVVLYMVNAAEDPRDAGYLDAELAVLAWMGKPMLALLNQTGPPREPEAEAADVARWRTALAGYPLVRGVLALDAFARCWVQEFVLLDSVGPLLSVERRPAFARLAAAWRARRYAQFDASMAALARPIAAAVCASVVVPRSAMLKRLGVALGVGDDTMGREDARAFAALSNGVTADVRATMDELIAIHGLAGQAAADVEARVDGDLTRDGPVDEGKAAAVGGVLSGAASGLAADLAAGGLTLGAGMLTGAVLGALGGAGVARALNVLRGQSDNTIRWAMSSSRVWSRRRCLRYLAVAHYGRGRGDYAAAEYPAFWRTRVAEAVAARGGEWAGIFARRGPSCGEADLARALAPLLRETALASLEALYPEAFTVHREESAHDQEQRA